MNNQDNPTVELSAHEKAGIESHFVYADRKVIAVWYWRTNGKKYTGYLRLEDNCRMTLEVRHLPHFGRRVEAFISGKIDWTNSMGEPVSVGVNWSQHFSNPGIKYWRFKKEHLRMMKSK